MKRYLTVIILIILYSCNEDEFDIAYETPKMHEYHPSSMFYPLGFYVDTTKVKLVYNKNNKVVQRIGHLVEIPLGYRLTKDFADTVIYYNDSIVIKTQNIGSKDLIDLTSSKRKLILENGLITKRIFKSYGKSNYDTLYYSYNDQKQIDEIFHIESRTYRKKNRFIYDDKDNLSLVISKRYKTNGDPNYTTLDTLRFFNYDDSPNPVKRLNIFQECFYRSLSTNNFREYSLRSYREYDSTLIATENRNWEFAYDEDNYPIF